MSMRNIDRDQQAQSLERNRTPPEISALIEKKFMSEQQHRSYDRGVDVRRHAPNLGLTLTEPRRTYPLR